MKIRLIKKPKLLLVEDNSKLPAKAKRTNITKKWVYRIDTIQLGVIIKYPTKKGYKFKFFPQSITPTYNRFSNEVEQRGYKTTDFTGLKETRKALYKALLFEANLIFTIQ